MTVSKKNSNLSFLFRFGVIAVLALLLAPGTTLAQTINASLGGIVSDSTGARVDGANIVLTNQETHDTRKTTTNDQGVFQFNAVPAGTYRIQVRHSGFGSLTENGIELHPNDVRNLASLTLKVGETTAEVTVTAENEMPTSGERSSLITSEDLKRLSTVGRDVSELLKTQAGFAILQSGLDNGGSSSAEVVGSGGSGLANYVGNGATGNGTSVISDGANVTDPGNGSGQTQNVNMDMVAEVKIQTSNFGADTAKGPTVITAVGKSGSSSFHGAVYAHGRTSQLNAEDWFMKYQGLPPLPDRYIYPGFNISGPVLIPGTNFNSQRKLTFFLGAEDYVQRNVYAYGSPLKSFINALVPTANMRNGDFTQGELANYLGTSVTNIQNNCTASGSMATYYHLCAPPDNGQTGSGGVLGGRFSGGAAGFDPGAAALLSTMPLPTGPTVNGYNWSAINTTNPDLYQIRTRVDYGFNDYNKIYGVYNAEYGQTSGIPEQIYYSPSAGGSTMGGLNTPGRINSNSTSNTASFNYTHIFNAHATNELFGALSYVANYYSAGNANALLSTTINYPYHGIYPTASKQYPQLSDYGVHGLPLAITPDFSNGRYISKKFLPSWGDNFTYLWRSHTVKAGVYLERDTANQTDLSPVTNGQITQYYVPTSSFTDAAGTHNPVGCNNAFSGCGANYLADFMLGDIDQFFQQNFNPQTNLNFWTVSWFVTDSWKATKKLTLDYGVRFDHLGPWSDSHGLGIAVFNPTLYATDPHVASTPGNPQLPGVRWHGDGKGGSSNIPLSGAPSRWGFVSPRFGLAYDLFGNSKTILRGGWGMYRSHDSWNDYSLPAATSQGLLVSSVGGSGVSLAGVDKSSAGFVCDASGTSGCPSISALDPTDSQQPLTMTYSFTVSQQMPWNSIFEIGYVGNQSHDLLTDAISNTIQANIQNVNAIPIGGLFQPDPNPSSASAGQILNPDAMTVAQTNDYRPYKNYTNLLVPRHILYANYNALQASWNKQTGHLTYGLNYTWSKAQGVRGGYNNGPTQDPTNLRANYGPLAFDRTNVAAATYSYDLGSPFHINRVVDGFINNWMISGITTMQSGPNLQAVYSPDLGLSGTVSAPAGSTTALNIDSRTLLGTPDVYLQPFIKAGCNPTGNLQKHQYVNGNCFAIGPYGVNGPTNLGNIRGPGFFNSDLALQKRIQLHERKNLEFRASAFNFLNHPITAFSSRYKNEATLQMAGSTFANASLLNGSDSRGCSVAGSQCFGYAGYKTGRRVMEISAKFNF